MLDSIYTQIQALTAHIEQNYQVNPWFFIALMTISTPVYYYGYFLVGSSLIKIEQKKITKRHNRRRLRQGIAVTVFGWYFPYVYVMAFGTLPLWLWVALSLWMLVLGLMLVRSLKRKMNQGSETDEQQVGAAAVETGWLTIITRAWYEFVYGGHFLALGDAVTLYVLGMIFGIPVSWDFLLIVYLCVFVGTLYNRSEESDSDALTNPVRVKIMKKYTDHAKYIMLALMLVVVALFLYYANVSVLLFACVIFLISIMYSVFLKGMTRKIVGFKNFIGALFYSLMIFMLVFYYSAPVTLSVFLIFIFYYIRIFISNAYCDFKDIEGDKKSRLKTPVVTFGERKTIFLLNILNIFSAVPIIYGVYKGSLPLYTMMILLTIVYTMFYLKLYEKVGNETLFNAIVDGEFILWLPFAWIGKVIL